MKYAILFAISSLITLNAFAGEPVKLYWGESVVVTTQMNRNPDTTTSTEVLFCGQIQQQQQLQTNQSGQPSQFPSPELPQVPQPVQQLQKQQQQTQCQQIVEGRSTTHSQQEGDTADFHGTAYVCFLNR